MSPAQIDALPDPAERAAAATTAIELLERQLEAVRFTRVVALQELHLQGVSLRKLADRYGGSKSTLAQLMS